MRFTVVGAPRAKTCPPKAYVEWLQGAMRQVPIIMQIVGVHRPIQQRVRVQAVFFLDRAEGERDSYEKALGEFLQRAGLLKSERLIAWSGSKFTEDRKFPRVEVDLQLVDPGCGDEDPSSARHPDRGSHSAGLFAVLWPALGGR